MEKRVNVLQERIRSGDKARKLAELSLSNQIAKLEVLLEPSIKSLSI